MSCDYYYNRSYEVYNATGGQLKIYLTVSSREGLVFPIAPIDTVFVIDDLNEATIHETPIVNSIRGKEYVEVEEDLTSILVILNDSIQSQTDYLESESWEFNEGVYKTVISSSDF